MEIKTTLNSNNATIMSTEEYLAREHTEVISLLIDKLMAAGKAGKRQGWSMSEILTEVELQLGKDALPHARRYIIQDVCGFN